MFFIWLSRWHFYTSRVADGTPHLGKSGPKNQSSHQYWNLRILEYKGVTLNNTLRASLYITAKL